MTTPVQFTLQVPTTTGTQFVLTAAGVSGQDTIQLAPASKTVLFMNNADTSPHTVSLTTLKDEWGYTHTVTYTVPAAGTLMAMLTADEFGTVATVTYGDRLNWDFSLYASLAVIPG